MAARIYTGYVQDVYGDIYVQMPADNQWGFSIYDDDQTFPGGFGIGEWSAVSEDVVSDADKERLSWILDSPNDASDATANVRILNNRRSRIGLDARCSITMNAAEPRTESANSPRMRHDVHVQSGEPIPSA